MSVAEESALFSGCSMFAEGLGLLKVSKRNHAHCREEDFTVIEATFLLVLVVFLGCWVTRASNRRDVKLAVERMNLLYGEQWVWGLRKRTNARALQSQADAFAEQMSALLDVLTRDVEHFQGAVYFWNVEQIAESDYLGHPEGPGDLLLPPEKLRSLEHRGQAVLRALNRLDRRAKEAGVTYPRSFAYYLRMRTHRGGLPTTEAERDFDFAKLCEEWRTVIARKNSLHRDRASTISTPVAR
ncbi:MAG: hypothetical protein IT290_01230 [Deltaproteobacteria bacterium]|nr:hypothetical protein [Deltaproteobacteria bacterium]